MTAYEEFDALVQSTPGWSYSLSYYLAEGEESGSGVAYFELELFRQGKFLASEDMDGNQREGLFRWAIQKIKEHS